MGSTLSLIVQSVQDAILSITPEDLPDVPWQYSNSTQLLGESMMQAGELARIFTVYPLINPEDRGRTNLSQAEITQSVIIEARYHVPEKRWGGAVYARLIAGSDSARVLHMLTLEWGYPAIGGESVSGPTIQVSALPSRGLQAMGNDNYLMRLEYRYVYTMDALGVDQSPAP